MADRKALSNSSSGNKFMAFLDKKGYRMERYRSGHNEAVLKTVWE